MITVPQREELKSDWFERNDDFTKGVIRKASKINSIAKYPFLNANSTDMKFIFSNIYSMGKSMLNAMCFKQRYILKISNNFEDSCTNGVEIMVSTDYFDSNDLTLTEKLDLFLGITIHEGLHCKFTDFTVYSKIPTSYNDAERKIIAVFQNIYEDERIEWLCSEQMPGYTSYISAVKKYYFDTLYLKTSFEEIRDSDVTTDNLVNMFISYVLRCVRYPTHLHDKHLDVLGEYLLKVKEILSTYPTSTKEVQSAAIKTFELIKEFIADKQDTDKSKVSNNLNSSQEVKDLIKKFLENVELKVVEGNIKSYELGESKKPKLNASNSYVFQELEGCVELKDNNVLFLKTYPNKEVYDAVLTTIRPYINLVRQTLTYNDKCYKIKHKSMFNGSLDTTKLVDSRCGVTNVYEKQGLVKTEKIAVCFNIDMSGSMGGDKIISAQKTAILLFEALRYNNSIELYIYGHTADNEDGLQDSTSIYTFYEPQDRTPYNLGNISSMSCNRDGVAILEIAKRVRSKTKRKCLMFVISDGAPYARSYHGEPAIQDTREKVLQVERTLNMDVVQIAIESEHEPSLMFSKFIQFTDIARLPIDLNIFIKKTLLKKQSIQYS